MENDAQSHEFLLTEDGSHTLLHAHLGQTYHSKYGAIQESQIIFINAGLQFYLHTHQPNAVHISEMGFGTGLNALMTYLHALNYPQIRFKYSCWEAYPVAYEQAIDLNYPELLAAADEKAVFAQMHACPAQTWQPLAPNFEFCKYIDDFEQIADTDAYDIVYYDAFAPAAQPELWTAELFAKIYAAMRPNGVLTTYCAKGVFKRILRGLGFQVNALAGPKGKREMTQAIKIAPIL